MNNIAVYSCITGGYEEIKNDHVWDGADFYFFTDKPVEGENWNFRKATTLFSDPRRNARYHKILSHLMFPEYEYTVWIDGAVTLKVPVQYLIDRMGKMDLLTFKHPDRKTVREEAEECIRLKRDYPDIINSTIKRLTDENFNIDKPKLAETRVVVRKNNEKVKEFNEEWFYRLTTGSLRDQLTFNFAAWKTGLHVRYMPAISRGNTWFEKGYHERDAYEMGR
jgi:hypothetical protein